MIQFWILFLFFTCFCAGVESESEYDDYYEYYDEKEQKISAEWKTLATEMFEGMSSNLKLLFTIKIIITTSETIFLKLFGESIQQK